jgi:hypothetical protein
MSAARQRRLGDARAGELRASRRILAGRRPPARLRKACPKARRACSADSDDPFPLASPFGIAQLRERSPIKRDRGLSASESMQEASGPFRQRRRVRRNRLGHDRQRRVRVGRVADLLRLRSPSVAAAPVSLGPLYMVCADEQGTRRNVQVTYRERAGDEQGTNRDVVRRGAVRGGGRRSRQQPRAQPRPPPPLLPRAASVRVCLRARRAGSAPFLSSG